MTNKFNIGDSVTIKSMQKINNISMFVEDAIKGGATHVSNLSLERHLLDPDVWRAVGVTRGWATDEEQVDYEPHRMGSHSDTWGCAGDDDPCFCNAPKTASMYQHKFLDHLQSGDTIEEALGKVK